jgi:serine/threonine protein kinase
VTLAPGVRLGPYQILAAIGAGGMGEVYKATDTRLGRSVAIKVLSEDVAGDTDFKARFDREARAISSLTHPHICTLYDVGHQNGTDYLVMEYLEGETLSERLARGALPFADALACALEISGALEKAHRQGIVHRDLKPGNIMLTRGGAKLLDFGLAKLRPATLAAEAATHAQTASAPLTGQGGILGTPQYMAPEQLEGRDADARTDIFAFGMVAYEMATGKRAFGGGSQASLIGAILRDEPAPVSTFTPAVPATFDRVIRRCLAKDPDNRWQSMADVRHALTWIQEEGTGVDAAAAPAAVPRRERFLWAAALIAALIASAFVARFDRVETEPPELRLEITTPPTTDLVSLALSPDGRTMAFVASAGGRPQLWVRSLDSVSARPLPGTDFARYPFWSPDSRSIGFFSDSQLKRTSLDSGSPLALANVSAPAGAAWNGDGTILYAVTGGGPIMKIAAAGGDPAVVTRPEGDQASHRFPQPLPGGEHFLYYVLGGPEVRGVYVARIDGSESRRVVDTDTAAVYSPSGHLLFVRQATLLAQAFDVATLTITGEPFQVAEQIARDPLAIQLAAVSASTSGTIAYRSGSTGVRTELVWFDRSGKQTGQLVNAESAGGQNPVMSADGRRVAWDRTAAANVDIWSMDLRSGAPERLTSAAAIDAYPVWSPDGTRIVYGALRNQVMDLYWKPVGGAGTEQPLLVTPERKQPTDWSADGRFILFRITDPATGYDIWALPLGDGRPGEPFPVVRTPFDEREAQFSADGGWIAYQSNESNRTEIYVQRFPTPDRRVRVSTNGGAQPRWSRDGRELFYLSLDGELMAVPIAFDDDGRTAEAGVPVPLFVARVGSVLSGSGRQQYMPSPDGQRFLINTVGNETPAPITLILNWNAQQAP